MAAHQVALQNQQLTFQENALAQTSEAAYVGWLREKRLAAMNCLQEAFEEVLEVTDLWGSGESRGETWAAWEAQVKAVNKKMASSAYRVRLVFGFKEDLLNDCSELAEFAATKFRLLLSPEEIGQTMDNRYEEHQLWREEYGRKYMLIWLKMHVLTTPVPKSERDTAPHVFQVKATEESTNDAAENLTSTGSPRLSVEVCFSGVRLPEMCTAP